MKTPNTLRNVAAALALGVCVATLPVALRAEEPANGAEITVTGEVLDLVCYTDHGATGEKHADCAQKCISSGLPVGIKAADGTVYLLAGEHKPANAELAPHAAKTITVRGKFVTRDGVKLIENIEIVGG